MADLKKYKKVLIVKLCCIGDIIQATPAIRAVKESGAEVHFLSVKWVSDLVDMVPYIDKKITISRQSPVELLKVMPKLIMEKYDLIINFHRDIKSNIFISLLGAKETAGFNWKGKGRVLKHKFEFDSNLHEALRYLSVVRGLGFADRGEHTLIKAPEIKLNHELSAGLKAGLFPGGGKNPGTVMTTKRWPIARFAQLVDLLEAKGITPYILGGQIDSDVAEELIKLRPQVKFLKTANLKELAVLLSKMDFFVAGDTGPLHMSAALGIKTVALFGPTSPKLVGVKGRHSVNLWPGADCAPCYEPESVHMKAFLNCSDNVCMQKISAQAVMDEILKLGGIK